LLIQVAGVFKDNVLGRGGRAEGGGRRAEEGRGKREEGRGKREEGRGRAEEGKGIPLASRSCAQV